MNWLEAIKYTILEENGPWVVNEVSIVQDHISRQTSHLLINVEHF